MNRSNTQVDATVAVLYGWDLGLDDEFAMAIDISTVGWCSVPTEMRYGWEQLSLYALGIGAQIGELDYIYEARGPRVFPTFAVVPALTHVIACASHAGVSLDAVVHCGQSIRVLGKLPPKGSMHTRGEIVAFYDLKRLAQMVVRTSTELVEGTPVFETEWVLLLRGQGGFGGKPPQKNEMGKVLPTRVPDHRIEQKTLPEQALLYRLSGDTNPLHVDPSFAAKLGFEQGPILHGLATLGFSARALIASACGGDSDRLRFISAQFKRPVWPGDTLATEIWRTDYGCVFRTKLVESDEIVIGTAWAEITK